MHPDRRKTVETCWYHSSSIHIHRFHTPGTVSGSADMSAKPADDWNARQDQYISHILYILVTMLCLYWRGDMKSNDPAQSPESAQQQPPQLGQGNSHLTMIVVFLATYHMYDIDFTDFSRISCRPVAKHSRSSTPRSRQSSFVLILCWYFVSHVSLHHDSRISAAAAASCAPWEFLHGTLVVSSWEKCQVWTRSFRFKRCQYVSMSKVWNLQHPRAKHCSQNTGSS